MASLEGGYIYTGRILSSLYVILYRGHTSFTPTTFPQGKGSSLLFSYISMIKELVKGNSIAEVSEPFSYCG